MSLLLVVPADADFSRVLPPEIWREVARCLRDRASFCAFRLGCHVFRLVAGRRFLGAVRCSRVLRGHTKSVRSVAVCGTLLATGAYDKTVRLWRLPSNECVAVLRGHSSTASGLVQWGAHLVSASHDHTARVWDVEEGRCVQVLEGHSDRVRAVVVWGDSLATASEAAMIRVWNAAGECTVTLHGHSDWVLCLAVCEALLASGSADNSIRLWDPRSHACVAELTGHTDYVRWLCGGASW